MKKLNKNQRSLLTTLVFIMAVISILSALNTKNIVLSLFARFSILKEYKHSLEGQLGVKIKLSKVQNMIHVPVFAVLGFYWAIFLSTRGWKQVRIIVLAVLLVGIFGMADEFHQHFVRGRDASSADVLLDVIGGSLGTMIGLLYVRCNKKYISQNPSAKQ